MIDKKFSTEKEEHTTIDVKSRLWKFHEELVKRAKNERTLV